MAGVVDGNEFDRRIIEEFRANEGGSATRPAWYHNLRAHPQVTVEVGARTFVARADELAPSARAVRWPQLVAASPALGEFQARTARQIPVLILSPLPGGTSGRDG